VGAGCSTAAHYLEHERGFRYIRLSDAVRAEWDLTHASEPKRSDLQATGDEMRRSRGLSALVDGAFEGVDTSEGSPTVVVDGVRNLGEVTALQGTFGAEVAHS
jgi:hypothetical protein